MLLSDGLPSQIKEVKYEVADIIKSVFLVRDADLGEFGLDYD